MYIAGICGVVHGPVLLKHSTKTCIYRAWAVNRTLYKILNARPILQRDLSIHSTASWVESTCDTRHVLILVLYIVLETYGNLQLIYFPFKRAKRLIYYYLHHWHKPFIFYPLQWCQSIICLLRKGLLSCLPSRRGVCHSYIACLHRGIWSFTDTNGKFRCMRRTLHGNINIVPVGYERRCKRERATRHHNKMRPSSTPS